jgi:hypothetical protein
MRSRKTALGALVSLGLLLGLAGLYFGEPPAPPFSIEFTSAYQNEKLLKRAWALPVARLYGPQGYLFQSNPSVCGPTSIADILRSEGRPADPSSVMNGSGIWQIFRVLPGGLTLDQEARILERNSGKPVKKLRDLSLDEFRAEMAKSNDPSRRIVLNFTRMPLFGRGHGHFSPILGYLADEDLVFVGDVNANYRPWLVPTSRLYDAENTLDSSSHAKRGLLEIEAF